ncbi:MAG TPA: OmpA family protein [Myxococcaceae bacterium]|nr:OmpA family protein [Myxococcaceae bacterium]
MLSAIRNTSAALALAAVAAGCGVSKDKYEAAVNEADKYKKEYADESQRAKDCEQKLATAGTKVQGLEQTTAAQQAQMDDYKTMNAALTQENAANLVELAQLSGLVTIRVPEKLLFAPGSAAITKQGKVGLKKIAAAMKSVSGRVFYVAGNTDNKPIKTRQFPSNWELSTARALAVIHFCIAEGVDPRVLGAAGYAQYHPIASNDSADGRARNRRIDIGIAAPPQDLPTAKQ